MEVKDTCRGRTGAGHGDRLNADLLEFVEAVVVVNPKARGPSLRTGPVSCGRTRPVEQQPAGASDRRRPWRADGSARRARADAGRAGPQPPPGPARRGAAPEGRGRGRTPRRPGRRRRRPRPRRAGAGRRTGARPATHGRATARRRRGTSSPVSSACSASRESTASPTSIGSEPIAGPSTNAASRASRCGSGSAARDPSAGRSNNCSPENGSSASNSTPVPRTSRMSPAAAAARSSNAVLPMPGLTTQHQRRAGARPGSRQQFGDRVLFGFLPCSSPAPMIPFWHSSGSGCSARSARSCRGSDL